jgi:Na+/H+ antiporter NhaC
MRNDLPILEFRFGWLGVAIPAVLFLAGVTWLGLSGAPDERGFWPILLMALTAGLLLARDRIAWCEAVLDGMSNRLVALMILAWLLAGVFASLMNATGFVESLVWLCQRAGLSGAGYVGAAFLIASAVSTATGTSLGTLLLTVPLLYPAGGTLGADPTFLIGALLAGATFGDNLSPVSDTTIASASSQGAAMHAVVRSRLRYALPAASLALLLYLMLGKGQDQGAATALAGNPQGLVMVVAPILVLALLLRRRHLIEGLLFGNLAAVIVGLAFSRITPEQLIFLDRDNFIARGLLAEGLERGVGISIFTLLLMGLVGTLERTGILERLIAASETRAHTARGAEIWIALVTTAVVLLTTHGAATLIAVGDFARTVGERFGLSAVRRANLLDLVVSVWPFVLPWFIPTILASSLTQNVDGMPGVGPFQAGVVNFHSWALLAMTVFAITTGFGRVERG